jgi:benzoyl-CoA reductase/2-hydroxyglutaryl-CoA dehydratase subunit BcrC/BadD/HgdB
MRMKISDDARDYIRANPDLANEIYNSGVIEGQSHTEPSPKTLIIIKNMEDKLDKMKDSFTTEISTLKMLIVGIPKQIIDETDKKYACKEVEDKVEKLRDERDRKTYDWLKYTVITIASVLIGYFFNQ